MKVILLFDIILKFFFLNYFILYTCNYLLELCNYFLFFYIPLICRNILLIYEAIKWLKNKITIASDLEQAYLNQDIKSDWIFGEPNNLILK